MVSPEDKDADKHSIWAPYSFLDIKHNKLNIDLLVVPEEKPCNHKRSIHVL